LPYPKSLSPTSIREFKRCPQSFLFHYILGIRPPTNLALAKGNLLHAAIDQVHDLKPHERTLSNAKELSSTIWSKTRQKDSTTYDQLFEGSREDEAEWESKGFDLLENYFQVEDPSTDSVKTEVPVSAELSLDPTLGVTAAGTPDADTPSETFLVRGIIDQIKVVPENDDDNGSSQQKVLRLTDFKSSKPPNLRYSPATNARIRAEKIEPLFIYALLWRESSIRQKVSIAASFAEPLRYLRLSYLEGSAADVVDYDLGATVEERDARLQRVHVDLVHVWRNIRTMVDTANQYNVNNNGDSPFSASTSLQAFVGCDRSFCSCHRERPRFAP
jgi:PD-(D/E)XK nuclease superfamily